MNKLDLMFPGVYSKFIDGHKVSMFIQSETELSLSQKMSTIGDLFAVCDEIDSLLARLSVFSAGEHMAALGGKVMCQSFDRIQDETRGTGSNTHTIQSAKLSILGTSTGEKYASNMLKFDSRTGSHLNSIMLIRSSISRSFNVLLDKTRRKRTTINERNDKQSIRFIEHIESKNSNVEHHIIPMSDEYDSFDFDHCHPCNVFFSAIVN
jgi:hypothetical protein